MARMNITYRQTHKARATSPIRQLLILLLTVIFGVLISVSVNAQKATVKNSEKKKAKVYKIKNRARANHYANACDILSKKRATAVNIRVPVHATQRGRAVERGGSFGGARQDIDAARQQNIIREMVILSLKERNGNEPIELAPLYFSRYDDRVSVGDINPFLIAVEFALQGRTIEIQTHRLDNASLNTGAVAALKTMMHKMGVPGERIAVTESATYADTDSEMFYLSLKAL